MAIGGVSGVSGMYNNMNSILQAKKNEEDVNELVESNDADKNGTLNKEEFVQMSKEMAGEGIDMEKLSDAVFGMFDKDGDGELTADEIREGREKLISQFDNKYGSVDTMTQVNSILNQTQQTLIDLMDSSNSNDNDDNENAFDFLTENYNAKVQEYLAQADITKSGDYSADAVNALLNGGSSLSEYI